LEPAPIGRRNGNGFSRAHRADSHAPRKTGIPKGTQPSDLIHYHHPGGAAGVLITGPYLVTDHGEYILEPPPVRKMLFTSGNPDVRESGNTWIYSREKGSFSQVGMVVQGCYGRTDTDGNAKAYGESTTCDVDVGFTISLIP
jgi:hypothetical protein